MNHQWWFMKMINQNHFHESSFMIRSRRGHFDFREEIIFKKNFWFFSAIWLIYELKNYITFFSYVIINDVITYWLIMRRQMASLNIKSCLSGCGSPFKSIIWYSECWFSEMSHKYESSICTRHENVRYEIESRAVVRYVTMWIIEKNVIYAYEIKDNPF